MKKSIKRIAPLKTGIVLGVLYALLALIIVPFFMLAGLGAAAGGSPGKIPMAFFFGIGALCLPILYGVMGFVFGVIAAAVYNLVAGWTGGIEITLEDVA